jgi:hypothetical protein
MIFDGKPLSTLPPYPPINNPDHCLLLKWCQTPAKMQQLVDRSIQQELQTK